MDQSLWKTPRIFIPLIDNIQSFCAGSSPSEPSYPQYLDDGPEQVVLDNASQFATDIHQWQVSPMRSLHVLSLILGITELPLEPRVPIADREGTIHPLASIDVARFTTRILRLNGRNPRCFASPSLHLELRLLAASFINIETLVFRGMAVHPSWHTVIHEFGHLRKLHFDSCIISEALLPLRHTELPIVELSLRNVSRCPEYHGYPHPFPTYPNALDTLASSECLTTLHLDRTSLLMIPFSDSPANLPTNAEVLHIHRSSGIFELDGLEHLLTESRIVYILDLCSKIKSFHLEDPTLHVAGHFFEGSGLLRVRDLFAASPFPTRFVGTSSLARTPLSFFRS
jgi:hypothetical protein